VRSTLAMISALGAMLTIALGSPFAASAQPFPNETIQGTVKQFDGGEHLYVDDVRGFTDDVALGEQTAVRPAGTQLAPGMSVTIHGYNAGHWFDATTIDVGATASEPPPAPPPQVPVAQDQPPVDDTAPVDTAPVVQPDPYAVAPPPAYPPYAYPYPVYYPYPAPVYYGWYGGAPVVLSFGFGGGYYYHGHPYHGRVWAGGGYRGPVGAYRGYAGGAYRGYAGAYRGAAGYRGGAGRAPAARGGGGRH